MKILGLDSSGLVASVALVEDDILIGEYTTDYKKTHSQTLLPMMDELKKMIELDLNTVDAIAISAGPGSFTGLRIGAATAKGLGLALNKPLIEVPTLEGLAWNLWGTEKIVCPMMDARRNQVYSAAYEFATKGEGYGLNELLSQEARDIKVLLESLNELDREVVFVGDGIWAYREMVRENCKVKYAFAPAGQNRQRGANIAALGTVYFAAGKTVTAAEHQPEYMRKSQAEREKLEFGH